MPGLQCWIPPCKAQSPETSSKKLSQSPRTLIGAPAYFPAGASLYSAIHVPTRVRLLARLDKTQAALELAEGSLEPMRRVVDRHIFEITQLLTAEMSGLAGREQRAVDLLSSCILDRLHQQPEILAESHRVTGQLLTANPRAAGEHLARAVRIFAAIGHEIGRSEAERCLDALAPRLPASGGVVGHGRKEFESDIRGQAGQAIRDLASALALSGHPRLMGSEILRAIPDWCDAAHVKLMSTGPNGSKELGSVGTSVASNSAESQPSDSSTGCGSRRRLRARYLGAARSLGPRNDSRVGAARCELSGTERR